MRRGALTSFSQQCWWYGWGGLSTSPTWREWDERKGEAPAGKREMIEEMSSVGVRMAVGVGEFGVGEDGGPGGDEVQGWDFL